MRKPKQLDNDFTRWRNSLGLNITQARDLLSMGATRATELSQGRREPNRAERFAMSAIALQVPEWRPGVDLTPAGTAPPAGKQAATLALELLDETRETLAAWLASVHAPPPE